MMLGPLVILAIGSAVGGFIDIPHFVEPALRVGGRARRPPCRLAAHRRPPRPRSSGSLLAYYLYLAFPEIPSRIYASARGVARVLENKYGFDAVYDRFASRGIVGGSEEVLWRGVDVRLIDGAVNGVAAVAAAVARSVRTSRSGWCGATRSSSWAAPWPSSRYLLWPR